MARRCVICDYCEVDEALNLSACPKCGNRGLPADPEDDVTVRVNWHELRIIGIWAEFWANANHATQQEGYDMQQTVRSILRRLEVQHPEKKTPLSLGGELRQLKQEFPKMETNIPHEEGFDPTV